MVVKQSYFNLELWLMSFFPIPNGTVNSFFWRNLLPDGTNDIHIFLSVMLGVCILNVLRNKDVSFFQVPHYADQLIFFTTFLL